MEVKIECSQEYGPVSEGEIGILEGFLGSNFPKDYRCFMLEHNGGTPFPDMFKIPTEGNRGNSFLVDSFYPIHSKRSTHNLIWYLKEYSDRIPNELMAIGQDPGGNQICIAISGKNYGSIYFWDHELECDGEPPSYVNVYFISSSFTEFLGCLSEFDE
ncbi:SMI1/KNR4 family protein [Photobacterium sp. OFAV2-7]|uniref:SMI1/KNR4 family protein n=1 Tax=Photobacterium sp. OFAV2-7 TaxID=2917748 RepID=UPI001EF408CE|nr:SMI1/KNR4 family protein [Photobacterium sp. OFAV2-7]MCG7586875.1 SMI1/KNR4 family protein [Photobacterium sp. OFAV2-7]